MSVNRSIIDLGGTPLSRLVSGKCPPAVLAGEPSRAHRSSMPTVDAGLSDGASMAAPGIGGPPPWDWLAPAYAAFTTAVLAVEPDYPCYFGVRGQLDGHNSFAALDERTDGAVAGLARSLVAFRRRAWSGPKRQSLIVF